MTDEQHLSRLRQGREAWNTWRQQHRDQPVNLSSADLKGADLRGFDLSCVNLRFADLSEGDLTAVNLRNSDLRFSSLIGTTLEKAMMRSTNLRDANLNDADLRDADLRFANLSSADLISTQLKSANLNSGNVVSADLRFADLRHADLSSTDLSFAKLNSADLSHAILLETKLHGAELCEATLTGACIQNWVVDTKTQFDQVHCDFIYLKLEWDPEQQGMIFRERMPPQTNHSFTPGDLLQWIRRTNVITVDLTFEAINWQVFSKAFQAVRGIYGADLLLIHSIETTADNALRIRISAPLGDIESQIRNTYEQILVEAKWPATESQIQMDWILESLSQGCCRERASY